MLTELSVLMILALVVAVMTVVGHGIWVLMAAIFGGAKRANDACPRCRSRLFNGRCPVCNWPATSIPREKTFASLTAVREQIHRYGALGLLDKAMCERLLASLEAERQRLAKPMEIAAIPIAELFEPIAPTERASHEISGSAPPHGAAVPVNPPVPHPSVIDPLDADDELRLAPDLRAPQIGERTREFVMRKAAAAHQAVEPHKEPSETPTAVSSETTAVPSEQPSVQPTEWSRAAPPPRRPVFDLLSAFLEEQNIRWGELIGGLLIVGCSIALVISFWAKIAERPFVKFFLFNGVTAALFGLGLHAAHRWKLRTTSRAVLMISILLVPLNFLAIAAFTESSLSPFTFSAAGEAISVALFAALCAAAGRIVTPRNVWLLVVGVLVPSMMELLVRRWVNPAAEVSVLLAIGAVPTAAYAAVNILALWRQRPVQGGQAHCSAERSVAAPDAAGPTNEPDPGLADWPREILALLGATAFAAALPLGLLAFKTGRIEATVHQLAILISAGGLTPLAVGLFLWQRLTGKSQATQRTAGLSIAVAGMLLLLAGVVLAWPDPAAMLPTAILVAVVLSAAAVSFRLAEIHCAAVVCLTLAYLTGWHLAAGRLIWRGQDANQAIHAFVSGASGQALVPLVAIYFVAAALLGGWLRRLRDARAVALAAAGVAALSAGLVGWFGFGVAGDPMHVTWIYALYGIAACAAATRMAWRSALWIGAGLTLAASVQGVVYLAAERWPLALPWGVALALEATLMMAAAAVCRIWSARTDTRRASDGFGQVALDVSIVALALVAAGSAGWPHAVSAGPLAIHWLWLAAVWLGLALLDVFPQSLFAAFQMALAVAAWFGVGVWLERREWFSNAKWRWLDPWTLQAEGVALAVFCLAWSGVRRLLRARPRAALLNSAWPADAMLLRLVLATLIGLSCYAAWPGVAQELSPREFARTGAPLPASTAASFEVLQIPHAHAQGYGSWLLLAAVVVALAAEAGVFGKRNRFANILLALFTACVLAAGWWEPQLAVASAIRWYAVFYLIAATAVIFGWQAWLLRRRSVGADFVGAKTAAVLSGDERALLLLLGGAPALAIACFAVAGVTLGGRPLVGPDPLSLFGRIGAAISYGGPVALLALTLVAYAVHERSSLFALAGGLTGNVAATIAYLLRLADARLPLDTAAWIGLAQLNAIVAAVYVLAWLGHKSWYGRRNPAVASRAPGPMWVQIGLAAACNAAVLAPAWSKLIDEPALSTGLLPVAGAWGWSAAISTIVAIFAAERMSLRRLNGGALAMLLWSAATLAAWTACRLDTGNWLGFHVLLLSHAAVAWFITGIGQLGRSIFAESEQSRVNSTVRWSLAGLALAVYLALRAMFGDPQAPWWTIGVLASQALLAAALAWWAVRAGLLYVAMPLINVAASIWWLHGYRTSGWRGGTLDSVAVNIVALALPGVAWLAMELLRFRPRRTPIVESPFRSPRLMPPHRFAARVSLVAMAILVGLKLGFYSAVSPWSVPATPCKWLALGATAALWTAMLWDGEAKDTAGGLYFVGLAAAGAFLDQIQPDREWLWWAGDIILAAYALATSFLWNWRAELRNMADRLRIPRGPDSPQGELHWLLPVNCAVVAIVVALSYSFVLRFDDRGLRLVAAKAVLAQMATLGLLARGERRWQLQYASLALGVLGAVAIGWAGLQPAAGTTLNRTVVAAAALTLLAAIYGLGLTKLLAAGNDWLRAARRLAPLLAAADVAAVLMVLAVEILQVVDHGQVAMAPVSIATMTAVLIGLCAAALAAAVLPGRDPLGLSERGRQAYVYAAETLLALVFVHLRLCVPQWFHGVLRQYWPLVVQGIAFVGVAIGEWFHRRRWTVVGEPLANTGALLPLLPVLGYWILPTRVDYSLLLLAVGLLYAALSVARRSFGFGLLAVAAANGSLWYFLQRHEGFGLLEHPQLWLIPPAFCVLIAAQLNRRQLTAAQMTSIRYGVSIVIYVSSTADIFIQGVARAPWLPLVLAGLSLAGVLLGIGLRVRAFLILGTSFLLLSLLTIIWYAAVDLQQTWLWYAAGIVVGVLILVVFAVFEKQRQAVTNLLDHLKKWQP
jgi:hypothetical protein